MHLIWDITNLCNLKCIHCGATELDSYPIGSFDNKIMLENISSFVESVDILGGEPLLYPNIFNIVKDLTKRHIKTSIITNGQFEQNVAQKLIETNIDIILVSIDGLKEDNDLIRGIGSWNRAVEFLQSLITSKKQYKTKTIIGINLVLNRYNQNSIIDAIKLFSSMEIDLLQINPMIFQGRVVSNKSIYQTVDELISSYETIAQYIKLTKSKKIDIIFDYPLIPDYLNCKYGTHFRIESNCCTAMLNSLYCNPYGELQPCRYYKDIKCDITKHIINWNDSYHIFQDFLSQTCKTVSFDNCLNCPHINICNPCPLSDNRSTPDVCKKILSLYNNLIYLDKNLYSICEPYNIIFTHRLLIQKHNILRKE